MASNDALDLRHEIRTARPHYPSMSNFQWLKTVTLYPARMLKLGDKLGVLKKGAWADMVDFELPEKTDPYEAVIRSTEKPAWMMIDGSTVNLS
jgi:imidazolonepropionase-like amidohydrolase